MASDSCSNSIAVFRNAKLVALIVSIIEPNHDRTCKALSNAKGRGQAQHKDRQRETDTEGDNRSNGLLEQYNGSTERRLYVDEQANKTHGQAMRRARLLELRTVSVVPGLASRGSRVRSAEWLADRVPS